MEKLSSTLYKTQRPGWDKTYDSYLAAATGQKIRHIIHTRKSGSFLETSYAYNPIEKLQFSDTFEVTSQLSVLKTLMDRERFSFTGGDVRLARLRSEGTKIDDVVTKRKNVLESLHEKIADIEENIKNIIELQVVEDDNQVINAHILDRMRTTLVYLRRKYRKFEYKLHDTDFNLTVKVQKSTKAKETKVNTSNAFAFIRNSINFETETKQKEIVKLEKNIKKRKDLSEKRLAHKHKQEEMMEKAMIEDQSAELEELRVKYLVHFM